MSNSNLVNHIHTSPNSSNPRNNSIKKITIHHMAGNLSVETCGNVFASSSAQASANYGVGSDGRVGLYVDESNRSWASSNATNDHQAITIEVANSSTGGEWPVSDTAYAKLIDLCVDICQRNGIQNLFWTGDSAGTLTCHYMFTSTACPGPYLKSKMPDIAAKVNARLNNTIEEDEEMTQEQFNSMMDTYMSARNADTTVNDWGKNAWDSITAAGVMDGTMPQGLLTREQAAVIFNKLGANAFKFYANVSDCPDWAKGLVQEMINAGFISGDGVNSVAKYHYQIEDMIIAYKMFLVAKGE